MTQSNTQQRYYWMILVHANMWPLQLWPYLAFGRVPLLGPRVTWGGGQWQTPTLDSYQLRQTWLTFRSWQGKNMWRSSTRDGTTWGAAEAPWMCGREQVTKIKRKNQTTLQCLAGAVRQQLMLKTLAILFIFFHHKQVLGSPGWEGHADKKRKEEPLFFWRAWSIQMNLLYRQALFLESARTPKCHSRALQ